MKSRLIIFVLLSMLFFSCKQNSVNKADSNKASVANNKTTKPEGKVFRLPPLPKGLYEDLFKHADYLDVIFEDLDFSLSQDNNAAIRSFLQNINIKRSTELNTSCVSMGHAVFSKHGDTMIECDIFHSSGCYYFIFNYEGDPPAYSNAMSEVGISFFNNLKNRSFKRK